MVKATVLLICRITLFKINVDFYCKLGGGGGEGILTQTSTFFEQPSGKNIKVIGVSFGVVLLQLL